LAFYYVLQGSSTPNSHAAPFFFNVPVFSAVFSQFLLVRWLTKHTGGIVKHLLTRALVVCLYRAPATARATG
jgi:hypothetical protein